MARPHRPAGPWSEKAFRDALRVAVLKAGQGGGTRLMRLADTLVSNGLAGDTAAIREIADRLDGKPAQSIDMAVTDERSVIRSPEVSVTPEDWTTSHKPH